MKFKLGKADVVTTPLIFEPDYKLWLGRARHFLGYRYRHYYDWDCALGMNGNPGFPLFKKEISWTPEIPTPLGRVNFAASQRQAKFIRQVTGIGSITKIDQALSAMFPAVSFPLPATAFKKHLNLQNKVSIFAWPIFMTVMVKLDMKNPLVPDLRLFPLSVPSRVSFEAFVTGYCAETAKKPPRKPVETRTMVGNFAKSTDALRMDAVAQRMYSLYQTVGGAEGDRRLAFEKLAAQKRW